MSRAVTRLLLIGVAITLAFGAVSWIVWMTIQSTPSR
jgi:hypothetical protein